MKKKKRNNTRDTNYFIKKCTNYLCSEWLLINKKMILMVGLDENQLKVGHINIL